MKNTLKALIGAAALLSIQGCAMDASDSEDTGDTEEGACAAPVIDARTWEHGHHIDVIDGKDGNVLSYVDKGDVVWLHLREAQPKDYKGTTLYQGKFTMHVATQHMLASKVTDDDVTSEDGIYILGPSRCKREDIRFYINPHTATTPWNSPDWTNIKYDYEYTKANDVLPARLVLRGHDHDVALYPR
jgi:hypothetical protein